MISSTGMWLAYLPPMSGVLFERLIGATKTSGTMVFLIYITDFVGYIGTIGFLLWLLFNNSSPGVIFIYLSLTAGIFTVVAYLLGLVYFFFQFRRVSMEQTQIDGDKLLGPYSFHGAPLHRYTSRESV